MVREVEPNSYLQYSQRPNEYHQTAVVGLARAGCPWVLLFPILQSHKGVCSYTSLKCQDSLSFVIWFLTKNLKFSECVFKREDI